MRDSVTVSGIEFASVSVIIPCYRCTETIERAVNSVVTQTLLPKEILLAEDFSGDDGKTLALLYQIQKDHHGKLDIRVLSLKKNSGPGGARNAGWEAAKQPYIAFLDSDDTWHCEKLRIQFSYMQNNNGVAVTGHCYIVLNRNNQSPEDLAISTLSYTGISPISLLFKNRFPTSSVMLKSDIPFRFATGKRAAEDTLLWQQISFSGFLVVRINVPLVYYFKALYGEGGLSSALWTMEKGELHNFNTLLKTDNINFVLYISAVFFSILKFIRRSIITLMKSISNNFF